MDEITERCRYLRENGEQCERDAILASADLLLCWRHVSGAVQLAALGKGPDSPPSTYVPPEYLVYYIQFRDRIKIGTTTNLQQRLDSLPHDRLLVTEPGDVIIERHRHAQFAHCRTNGEWFAADDPSLRSHIDKLRHAELHRCKSEA